MIYRVKVLGYDEAKNTDSEVDSDGSLVGSFANEWVVGNVWR